MLAGDVGSSPSRGIQPFFFRKSTSKEKKKKDAHILLSIYSQENPDILKNVLILLVIVASATG